MKNRIISLMLAIASLVLLLSLTACKEEPNDEWKNDMYLFLVNKTNPVGANYVPDNLVKVDDDYTTGGKFIELEKTTANAAIDMIDAMREDGITNVSITSGYRTYQRQKDLFEGYCATAKIKNPTWSDEEVKAFVLKTSAYPGTSEHQTGLCMDLFTNEMLELENYGYEGEYDYDKGFAETAAFEWLQKNAHKYGFILRFPDKPKTEITGYSYESWHYRYVGVEHATKIYEQKLCLEEYLAD